jgi:exopolysaccharide production protein ExoY
MSDVNLSTVERDRCDNSLSSINSTTGPHGLGLSASAKRSLDFGVAAFALILLAPLLALTCAAILIIQGRPLFYSQERIGQYGAVFRCLKFRTMVNHGDEVLASYLATNPAEQAEWAATRKLKSDPRITPLGRFLRKSSLDEVPQLVNILVGDMSLVGPRPIIATEMELYGQHFSDYIRVRPGLTGLWQISGRSDTTYLQRVTLDVLYVHGRTFWGDVKIMIKTVPAVIKAQGSY